MHDCICQHNMGQQRISIVPACAEGISHTSLLNDHSTCITREYGETVEAVHQTNDKDLSTVTLSNMEMGLEAELNNLNSIYTSYQPLILAATQLLQKEPSFDGIPVSSKHMKRSLQPFLGDALSWLTGTAATKDVNAIRSRINHLISMQHNQQETLVNLISILNVTRYVTQVNRHHINTLMDTTEKTHQDVRTLYIIMHFLHSSISYHQIILHVRSVLSCHYTTCEKLPFIPWIILMQPLQENSLHTSYLFKI